MTTLATIRAAIKAKLLTVANIGQVHDYERFAATQTAFLALYQTGVAPNARILGWWFDLASERRIEVETGLLRVVRTWQFVGFCGLEDADATAKIIQDLAQAIVIAFCADRQLGGTVIDQRDLDANNATVGPQFEGAQLVMFAGASCHRATLRLTTENHEAA